MELSNYSDVVVSRLFISVLLVRHFYIFLSTFAMLSFFEYIYIFSPPPHFRIFTIVTFSHL